MRRTFLALLTVAALVVAGCGGKGSSNNASSSTSSAPSPKTPLTCGGAINGVTVTGDQTKQPTVKIDSGLKVSTSACQMLIDGSGPAAKVGDTVVVHYDFFIARTGKTFDSSYSKNKDAALVLSKQFLAGLPTGLLGAKAGARVVTVVAPKDGYGPEGGQSSYGITKDDSLVFVADVLRIASPLARATGDAVAPVAGLPTVTLGADGTPTITVPKGVTPAAQLVSQTLIKGKGAPVATGQTLTVHYTGLTYANGKVFDSTWKAGREPFPFELGMQQVIAGWDTGLLGQTVGSQVLLVVPPVDGYGAAGNPQAGISATDTLVFVVDILNAA